MCSIAKLSGVIIAVAITLITSVIFWEQIKSTDKDIQIKLIEAMGGSSSQPVQTVETHQNAVELRFDHMALGGTAVLLLVLGMLFYCHYMRIRKKLKAHIHRSTTSRKPEPVEPVEESIRNAPSHHPPPNAWVQTHQHTPAPYQPYQPPMITPDFQWIQMEVARQIRNAELDLSRRFIEIPPDRPLRRGLDTTGARRTPLPSPPAGRRNEV